MKILTTILLICFFSVLSAQETTIDINCINDSLKRFERNFNLLDSLQQDCRNLVIIGVSEKFLFVQSVCGKIMPKVRNCDKLKKDAIGNYLILKDEYKFSKL
jgi:hypothetical protein